MRAWLLLAQLLAPPAPAPAPAAAPPTEVVVAKTAPDTVVVKATPTVGSPAVEVVKPSVSPEVTVKAGISNEVWIALISALAPVIGALTAVLLAILKRLKHADLKRTEMEIKTDKAAVKQDEANVKTAAAAVTLEQVHGLVHEKFTQLTAMYNSSLGEVKAANERIAELQKLVALLTPPPSAAEVAAMPAMTPTRPRTGPTGPLGAL